MCSKCWLLLSVLFCSCTWSDSSSSMESYLSTSSFKALFSFDATGIVSWKFMNLCQNQPTKSKVVIKINFHSHCVSKNSAEPPKTAWQHYNSLLKALKHVEVWNVSVHIFWLKFHPNHSRTEKRAASTEKLSPSETKY